MKHLLRELGVVAILLCALNVNAQTLMGLAQYGVTLNGTPADPVVVNGNDRAIVAQELRVLYDNLPSAIGFTEIRDRPMWRGATNGLEPGKSEHALQLFVDRPPMMRFRGITPGKPVSVALDSVLFKDGEFVGPDIARRFNALSERMAAIHELAVLAETAHQNVSARAAFWSELERLIATSARYKIGLAADMRSAHNRGQDDDAFQWARRAATLPTPWRKQ